MRNKTTEQSSYSNTVKVFTLSAGN